MNMIWQNTMSSIDQLHTSKYAKNSDVLMKIMAPNSTLAKSRDVRAYPVAFRGFCCSQ